MKKIVVPAEYAGRNSACPKCHANIAVPGQAVVSGPRPKKNVKKPSKLKPVLVALSVVLVVGIAVTGTILSMGGGGGGGGGVESEGDDVPGNPPPGRDLASLPVKQMVCRVVPGVKIVSGGETVERWFDYFFDLTLPEAKSLSDWEKKNEVIDWGDGTYGMRTPAAHGSGFLITSDGYILTNRHVVEDSEFLKENPEILRRFKLRNGHTSITPKIYVLFDGKSYETELIHVSKNFDVAVLKAIGFSGGTPFKLSASNDVPTISDIYVLGFPGDSERAGKGTEEETKQTKKRWRHDTIEGAFDKNQLTMNSNSGTIGKIKDDDELGRIIQYDCPTAGGNSGGPAVTPDGIVRGVHTWGLNAGDKRAKNKINGAGLLLPMRGEIDGAVGASKVNWVDDPDKK
ncbi:MAG: serine protease [Flavobacteriales bacterium]|nr:serine protease [Flavobacteriales bacterium]